MKIGFIGYGSMAESLASRWLGVHEIFIGGRNAAKAQALAERLGPGVSHGSEAAAAELADVVVLATTNDAVFAAIDAAGGPAAFDGKLVVDINNPVDVVGGDFVPRTFDGLSLGEAIAAYVPRATVVKAFNMCQARVWKMDPPMFDGRKLVVLHCGGDAPAKERIAGLIRDVGADPVDVGELKYARLLEAAAAIVIKFIITGREPFTVLNLIQPGAKPIA